MRDIVLAYEEIHITTQIEELQFLIHLAKSHEYVAFRIQIALLVEIIHGTSYWMPFKLSYKTNICCVAV